MRDPGYVGRWLAFTHKLMRAELDLRLAEAGGSLTTWVVLRNALHEPPLSQRDLADALGLGGPTLVRHLDRLAAQGLVERRRDPDDRRIIRVAVTPEGLALLERLHAVAAATEAEVREVLGSDDHDALRDALRRVHDHFGKLADERKFDANRDH